MTVDHNAAAMPPFAVAQVAEWRTASPEIGDERVRLRELRSDDAPSLVAHLGCAAVTRYLAPCPSTVEQFQRFIDWTHTERRRGSLVCVGIVPVGEAHAVGLIQFWPVDRNFFTAEWGFVLGERFWGTGLFMRAASLAIDAAVAQLGVYRLEARAVDANRRGNRALEKLGATRDGVLRGSFLDGDLVRDHVMWSILAPEWRARRAQGHAS